MSIKKPPYGQCNFANIIESGYAYVDKTRYIELLENEANTYQFVLRPRRFGKSLFLSTLDSYYDLNSKDKFESLFGGLYIGSHPTPERGRYAVLSFDFSSVETENHEIFRASFAAKVQGRVCMFLERYDNVFTNAAELLQSINEEKPGIGAVDFAYRAAKKANVPIFVIIDEYDNFANNLAAMEEAYREEITGKNEKDGIVRTFYKSLKEATASVVRRIFITGVSPMMVNDLTSGFNMADDLSLLPKYNEMFGFTRDEVEWLMNEIGIDKNLITVDMEYYYNGYMFNNEGLDKVYNSQMILFLFNKTKQLGKQPDEIVDNNLKTKYERLQRLAQSEENLGKLMQISNEGGIIGRIYQNISVAEMNSDEYFISMLFYMGMLTRSGSVDNPAFLKIPNYSIKTLYWDYVMKYAKGLKKGAVDTSKLLAAIDSMAFKGKIKPYLDFFVKHYLPLFANRDLRKFNETYIKAMMLPTLYASDLYYPVSEAENINGYTDIYLLRSRARPDVKYEYILELKYVKTGASQEALEKKFADAFSQINKYKKDKRFAGRKDVKFAAIVFVGRNGYEVREAG